MKYLAYALLMIMVGLTACNKYKQSNELSLEDAVSIAKRTAKSDQFDISKCDIEAVKVKDKYEKGPIRLSAIVKYFPKEKYRLLLDNQYWIVYFYPKGALEKPEYLGGEFHVLVDLHTGKVLASFKGY
jgi:hypothetical protein